MFVSMNLFIEPPTEREALEWGLLLPQIWLGYPAPADRHCERWGPEAREQAEARNRQRKKLPWNRDYSEYSKQRDQATKE